MPCLPFLDCAHIKQKDPILTELICLMRINNLILYQTDEFLILRLKELDSVY